MKIISPRDFEICRATPSDIDCIFGWLQSEYKDDPGALSRVRASIRDADENRNDLWVCRQNGAAVGYQAGDYAPEYLFVRTDLRRKGVGTALVEAAVARAIRDNLNTLEVQCEPTASLAFWLKLGFHDVSTASQVLARRTFAQLWTLPIDRPQVPVRVRFYRDEADRSELQFIEPVADMDIVGAVLENGSIQLDRRVLCRDADRPHTDLSIWIVVDGCEICFGKAKSIEARAAGVKDDRHGQLFYIDQVTGGVSLAGAAMADCHTLPD